MSRFGKDGFEWKLVYENDVFSAIVNGKDLFSEKFKFIGYKSADASSKPGIFCCEVDEGIYEIYDTTGRKLISRDMQISSVSKIFEINCEFYLLATIGDDEIIIAPNGEIVYRSTEDGSWVDIIENFGRYYIIHSKNITKNSKEVTIYGVYSIDGEELIPLDRQYENVTVQRTAGRSFLVTKDGLSGLCDEKGNEIVAPKYKELTYSKGKFYTVNTAGQKIAITEDIKINDKSQSSAIDVEGIDPAKYDIIAYYERADEYSYYKALKNDVVEIYDNNGNVIIPSTLALRDATLINGYGHQAFLVTKGDYKALVSTSGKTLIPSAAGFKTIEPMKLGYVAMKPKGFRLIDVTGTTLGSAVLTAWDTYTVDNDNDVLKIYLNKKVSLYSLTSGKLIIPATRGYSTILCSDNYYSVYKGDYMGICDKSGKEIISPDRGYTYVSYDDDYIRVKKGEYAGICDKSGKEILSPDRGYTYASYHDDYIKVSKGDYDGICDKTGKEVISPDRGYTYAGYDDDYIIVKKGEYYGRCDKTGKEIISPDRGYNYVFPPSDNYIKVKKGEYYGLCDKTGKELLSPDNRYTYIEIDKKRYVKAKNSSGYYGLYNSQGELILSHKYTLMTYIPDEDYWSLRDQDGDYSRYPNGNATPSAIASTTTTTTASSSNSRTYYRFITTYGGNSSPGDNAAIVVTFNSDNTLTIDGRKWTYKKNPGAFCDEGWVSGHDFVTFSHDKSDMTVHHTELIAGMFYGEVLSIKFTSKQYSNADMINFCNMLNGAGQSMGGSTNSSGNSSTSRSNSGACTLCDGRGYVIKYSAEYSNIAGKTKYCKECRKEVSLTHYHQTCPSCKGSGRK